MTAAGGTLFFTADDGAHGYEPWKSDGTEPGTALLKDVTPGKGGGPGPGQLTATESTLFFTADDGVHGRELWKSDGTEPGTALVKDINGHFDNFGENNYLAVGGSTLFFTVTTVFTAGNCGSRTARMRARLSSRTSISETSNASRLNVPADERTRETCTLRLSATRDPSVAARARAGGPSAYLRSRASLPGWATPSTHRRRRMLHRRSDNVFGVRVHVEHRPCVSAPDRGRTRRDRGLTEQRGWRRHESS